MSIKKYLQAAHKTPGPSVRMENAPERVASEAYKKVLVHKTFSISLVSKLKKIQLNTIQGKHLVVVMEGDVDIAVIPIIGLPLRKSKSCRLLSNISSDRSSALTLCLSRSNPLSAQ